MQINSMERSNPETCCNSKRINLSSVSETRATSICLHVRQPSILLPMLTEALCRCS